MGELTGHRRRSRRRRPARAARCHHHRQPEHRARADGGEPDRRVPAADLPPHPRCRRAALPRRRPARGPGVPVGRACRRRRPRTVREGSTMTARFLAVYEAPADPEAFDRHYREVHIPLIRHLPGLRRYTVGRDVAPLHGAPYYLITELEWDTMDELRAAFASPEGRATAADAARLQEIARVHRMIFTMDDSVIQAHASASSGPVPISASADMMAGRSGSN